MFGKSLRRLLPKVPLFSGAASPVVLERHALQLAAALAAPPGAGDAEGAVAAEALGFAEVVDDDLKARARAAVSVRGVNDGRSSPLAGSPG